MIGIKELAYRAKYHTYRHHELSVEEFFGEIRAKEAQIRPFVIGKIGGTELWALRAFAFSYKDQYEKAYDQLCNWSGFFSDNNNVYDNLHMFSDRMKMALKNVDYLIRWQGDKEEYFVSQYCSKDVKEIDWISVVYKEAPIGPLLRGKKVLAVTPFDNTVRKQYERRELIYSDEYLPEFNLKTYKAVQTLAGNKDPRFNSWFEALDGMISDIKGIDFDIALVGAGAYGLPICSAIKDSGRSAIHMGGDLQLMFGIMGKRWEDHPFVNSVRNEYWVYPSEADKPKNLEKVEDGCYW